MKLLVPIYSHSSVQIQHDTTACFFSRTHLLKFQSFFPNSQVNAKSDTLAQGATAYSSQEIIYIKRLVSLSFSLLLSSDSFRLEQKVRFLLFFFFSRSKPSLLLQMRHTVSVQWRPCLKVLLSNLIWQNVLARSFWQVWSGMIGWRNQGECRGHQSRQVQREVVGKKKELG